MINQTEDRKLLEISNLFSYGVFLVVIGHAYLAPNYETANPFWYIKLRNLIYSFHMPLFFFISGFLFIHSNKSKQRKYLHFIKKRAYRLLIPYFSLTLIALIPKYILSSYTLNLPPKSFVELLIKLLYPWQTPVTSYWFLPTIFLISVISPLFVFLINRNLLIFGTIIITSISYLSKMFLHIEFLNISGAIYFSFFFWFGCIVYMSQEKLHRYFTIYIGCLIFVIFISLNMYNFNILFLNMFRAILGISFSYLLIYQLSLKKINFLSHLHTSYYQIYLLSWFVQRGIMVLYRMFDINFYLLFPISIIGGIYIPIGLVHLIKKHFRVINPFVGL